jgi:hypothetical protein
LDRSPLTTVTTTTADYQDELVTKKAEADVLLSILHEM